ncbi:hypothetical protein [Trichormus sp. NMC-1]|uniref:hypothetical protein n=1 Tax=Trichormus sp. NMC-1 TaxID=1853259 RepID=UPI0008DBFE4B|nr:hypothetical protein [Trichormus sp. NMC-1]
MQIKNLIYNYPSHSFVIDYKEAEELFQCVREPTDLESNIEQLIFHLVRRPIDIIDKLQVDGSEDDENEDGNHRNNEGLAEGSVQPNNGKDEEVEQNRLLFEERV